MSWWIIPAVLLLLAISYQDFRSRSVNVFLFVVLASLLVYASLKDVPLSVIAIFTGLNLLYVTVMLVCCGGYVYWKYGSFRILRFIGLGDIFLFAIMAIWFSPVNFIVFNTMTFAGAAALHFFLNRISTFYNRFDSVPLAGFQSICFVAVLFYNAMR